MPRCVDRPSLTRFARSWKSRPAGIKASGYGVLIGGLLQYVVQWPSLRRAGFRVRPMLSFSDRVCVASCDGSAVIGCGCPGERLINSFASNIPGTGPVSWLNYAFQLISFRSVCLGSDRDRNAARDFPKRRARRRAGFSTFLRFYSAGLLLTIRRRWIDSVGSPDLALIYERGLFGGETPRTPPPRSLLCRWVD
jgi:putative peptidoglycan lipid II flippase